MRIFVNTEVAGERAAGSNILKVAVCDLVSTTDLCQDRGKVDELGQR